MLTMSVEPDSIMLQGLRAREEGAVARLLELYWERAYRVALQLAPDASAAEDVAQETFLAVLEGLPSLRDERRFRPWFFSVLTRTATKHHRSRTRRRAHEARGLTGEETRDPMKLAQDQEQAALVRTQIRALSPKLRHALTLRYLEGLSLNEVAEALDVPRKTVSSRIRLGLEALKTSLDPALGGAAVSLATLPIWVEGALRVAAPPSPSAQTMLAKLAGSTPPAAAAAEPLRAGLVLGLLGLVGVVGLSAALGPRLLGAPGGASSPQPSQVASADEDSGGGDSGGGVSPARQGQPAEGGLDPHSEPAARKKTPRAQASPPSATPASPPAAAAPSEAQPTAEVAGRVLDAEGRPIPFARVVVAMPARDMRDLVGTEHLPSARTDAGGYFLLTTPIEGEEATATLEVYAKGFGTLWRGLQGHLRQRQQREPRGRAQVIEGVRTDPDWILRLTPGGRAEVEVGLGRTTYVGGQVIDSEGAPVPGVRVTAIERDGSSYGYVALRETDAEGRFEVFDYPLPSEESGAAELVFEHPRRQRVVLKDAYALHGAERAALQIVLPLGLVVRGRAVDTEGAPLAGVLVTVEASEAEFWRACRTNEAGEFELAGLPNGAAKLRLLDLAGERKAVSSPVFVVDTSLGDVVLEQLRLPRVEVRELLGMKVATLTPELREAYELSNERGVLILDPGPEQARLGIGRLEKGDVFWRVGRRRVASVEEFAAGILEQRDSKRVRVVYSFRRPGESSWMSNTQSMTLTAADLAGAEEVLGR